ncbi:flagellar basal-body MS-ring/collar protein FliF [Vibrio cincinnatiensis]|uniref:flagellar basal-body MS-ring/collar protein FliF n=1 Tax=Vibrio cincinnatiensis TaxID=675 RepID=UPI001EE0ACC4|nr:flagellar basal-body MS-ring/collar protein FliF [Vibrio cincinnatiensis]MCG3723696.1 flagellar M-ring protein FliF [Vibrio cincinnatiensis]
MGGFNLEWKNIGARKSLVIGGITCLFLIMSLVLLWWLYQPEYEVLFDDLAQSDAAEITQSLKAMELPYSLENNGTTIKVDKRRIDDTRLELTSEQLLLTKPVGFEIFNDTDFGLTEFAQKVNYQRALEGELARTLTTNKQFKHARVHLSLPEKRAFQREEDLTKAAVTIVTVDQSRLTAQQVMGIQSLVAASVPSLEKDNVTVLDGRGEAYHFSDTVLDVSGSGDMRLDYQKKLETYFEQKVSRILAPVFGAEHLQIGVNATLDFNKIRSQKQELTTPEGEYSGYLKRRIEKRDQSKQPKVKDVENMSVEQEFAFGSETIETEKAAGQLSRLTVAVLINSRITEHDLKSVRELIAATVGIDPIRGDQLTVETIAGYQVIESQVSSLEIEPPVVAVTPNQPVTEVILNKGPDRWNNVLQVLTQPIYLFILLVGFLGFGGVIGWFITQSKLPKKLTQAEREKLLEEVQEWLFIEHPIEERHS